MRKTREAADSYVELVRHPAEQLLGQQTPTQLGQRPSAEAVDRTSADLLLGQAVQLTEKMAPQAFKAARRAGSRLGVVGEIEIFQTDAERDNASAHGTNVLRILMSGRWLATFDGPALESLFGHEMGHILANHTWRGVPPGVPLSVEQVRMARFNMAKEVTADRFAVLACDGIQTALRQSMMAVTGLPAGSVTWDTDDYLAKCRATAERLLAEGRVAAPANHPDHGLRSYAQWLFSRSDVYFSLTGKGDSSLRLSQVNETISRLLGLDEVQLQNTTAQGAGGAKKAAAPATSAGGDREGLRDLWRRVGSEVKELLASGASNDEARGEEPSLPDPLAADEDELAERFAALEKRVKGD